MQARRICSATLPVPDEVEERAGVQAVAADRGQDAGFEREGPRDQAAADAHDGAVAEKVAFGHHLGATADAPLAADEQESRTFSRPVISAVFIDPAHASG